VIDGPSMVLAVLNATEEETLIWKPDPDCGCRAELDGAHYVVTIDDDRQVPMLIIGKGIDGCREHGGIVDELYDAVHRQIFYRSKIAAALYASLTPPGGALG